jgi:hypothetical protein
LDKNGLDDPGDGRRNLRVDFVGRDLYEGLVDLDAVTNVLEPTGDGTFGDTLTECREADGLAHELNLLVSVKP